MTKEDREEDKEKGLEKSIQDVVEGEVSEDEPKKSVSKVLQQLEVLAMRRGLTSEVELGDLNESQLDKVLEIAKLNEENAFQYHTKKLESDTELEKERISASVISQKTTRIIGLGLLLFFLIIFCIVLFLRPEYFVALLTFVTGLAGGFGLSKLQIFLHDERTANLEKNKEKET